MNYYYEITFLDGRKIRRTYVSKKLAESVCTTMSHEMILFNVKSATWGKL